MLVRPRLTFLIRRVRHLKQI